MSALVITEILCFILVIYCCVYSIVGRICNCKERKYYCWIVIEAIKACGGDKESFKKILGEIDE